MKVALLLCFLATTQAFVVVPYSAGTVVQQPISYSIPVVQAAPVHPGYVAMTPGATHVAPLPEGLAYAAHHINIEKAPGSE